MKKNVIVVLLMLAIATSIFGQSFNDQKIVWNKFQSTVIVKNNSIISNLKILPAETSSMYEKQTWGTVYDESFFNGIINQNLCKFWFVTSVSRLGDVVQASETSDSAVLELSQRPVESKMILVNVQFTDPFTGDRITKLVQLDLNSSEKTAGVKNKFGTEITNENLGLNVLDFEFKNEQSIACFLENKQLGIKIVISSDETGSKPVLAPAIPPDGVYDFICQLDLPIGVSAEQKVKLFVKDGQLTFKDNTVNPLSFGKESIFFSGEKTLVKIINTRSEPIVVIVPKEYVLTKTLLKTGEVPMLEYFPGADQRWSAINIAPGKSTKISLTTTLARVIVKGKNGKARFEELFLTNDNFQVVKIGW
jgi:hypothetical protein